MSHNNVQLPVHKHITSEIQYLRICVQIFECKLSPAQTAVVGIGHGHKQLVMDPVLCSRFLSCCSVDF